MHGVNIRRQRHPRRHTTPWRRNEPALHEMHAVEASLSSSVVPGAHCSAVQAPDDPVGAYVPAPHDWHGVAGSESWSVCRACTMQEHHDWRTLRIEEPAQPWLCGVRHDTDSPFPRHIDMCHNRRPLLGAGSGHCRRTRTPCQCCHHHQSARWQPQQSSGVTNERCEHVTDAGGSTRG